MADVSLYTGEEKNGTYVSNVFIDNYMKQANGEYVKIYLYLLRSLGTADKDFSINGMADALDHTSKDIARALRYWEKENLIRLDYNSDGELTGICLLDPDQMRHPEPMKAQAAMSPKAETAGRLESIGRMESIEKRVDPMGRMESIEKRVDPMGCMEAIEKRMESMDQIEHMEVTGSKELPPIQAPKIVSMSARRGFATAPDHSYSMDELTLLRKDDEVREILFVTESYMGHPLSPTETNTVLYWYDGMLLSSDLIEYLVESCVDRGHRDIRYMNSVAINWCEEGIDTKEKALLKMQTHSAVYHNVIDAFGIKGRNLSVSERKYIDTWQSEYGFSADIIKAACERTILTAQSPSFAYADKILTSWKEEGVMSLSDVKVVDDAFSKRTKARTKSQAKTQNVAKRDRFHNFTGHDYDFDSIESRLLKQE